MRRLLTSFIAGIYLLSINPMPLFAQKNTSIVKDSVPQKEKKSSVLIKADKGGKVSLGDASVEIPANALEKDTEISITRLSSVAETGEGLENVTCGGGGYRFLPAGTKFKIDAVITLPYEHSVQQGALEETNTYFYDTDIKEWVALERIEIDHNKSSIISRTSHFTDMINGAPSMPESPSPADVSLNSIKNLEAANPSGIVLPLQGLEPSPTGEASFNFELEIPTGIHEMQPHVTLSYSSGSNSGNAGRGFSINAASSITTDTRHGLPAYDGVSDTYLKDGILLKRENNGSDVVLDRYKPLKENSYETIIANRSSSSKKILSWTVTTKDGKVLKYGNEPKSYSSQPENAENRFSWYVTKETDLHGNTIDYSYINDNESIYISEISYSGNKIKFAYENREDVRVDARSRFVQRNALRIKSVTTYYGSTLLKTYSFNYEYGLAKQSILTSFSCRSGSAESNDWNYTFEYEKPDFVNGKLIVFDPMTEWTNGKPLNVQNSSSSGGNVTFSAGGGFGLRSLAPVATFGYQGSSSSGNSYTDYMTLDLNGDGVLDCVRQISADTLVIYKGNSDGSFSAGQAISGIPLSYKIGKETNTNSSHGSLIYGGISTTLPVSAGVTRSSIKQSGELKVYSMFSDIDGDGLTDIIEKGNSFYLKNISTDSSFAFEPRGLNNNVNGIYREYTHEEKSEYNSVFYVQTPFRAWRAPFTGSIVMEYSADWMGGSSSTNFADIMIFHGGTRLDERRLSSVSESYKKAISLSVNVGDYIYFVSSHNNDTNSVNAYDVDLRNSDIKWNVSIAFSDIQPFDRLNAKLFFSEPSESVSRTESSKKMLEHVYPDYPEIDSLYNKPDITENMDSDDETVISYTALWSLKSDWRDVAHNADGCARYFIDNNLFFPIEFTSPQFNELFSCISDSVRQEFSCFVYDAERDIFHVTEELQNSGSFVERMGKIRSLLDKDDDRINGILKETLHNHDLFGYTAEWLTDNKVIFSDPKSIPLDSKREEKKTGSIYKNGKKIVLKKYNGKTAHIDDGKLYIDGSAKNNKVNVTYNDEKDSLTVTISEKKDDSVQVIYNFDTFTKIALRLEKDELKTIRDLWEFSIGDNRKKITLSYWKSLPKENFESDDFYLSLDDEEKKFFQKCFKLVSKKDIATNTTNLFYERNKNLSDEQIKHADELLDNYSLSCFYNEIASDFYMEEENYYSLRQEYQILSEKNISDTIGLFSEYEKEEKEKLTQNAGKLQEICANGRYGKYLNLTAKVSHTVQSVGIVTDDVKNIILMESETDEDAISVHDSVHGTLKLSWQTEDDFSIENNQKERTVGNINFSTDSILYGGINNWYCGIWNGTRNENSFSEKRLNSVLDGMNEYNTQLDENACKSKGSDLENSVREIDDNSVPQEFLKDNIFTLPVSFDSSNYPEFSGSDGTFTEADTNEDLSISNMPGHILGDFSVINVTIERWTTDGNLEQVPVSRYYAPFITKKGVIHANRYGGSSFYDILFDNRVGLDSLRKTETDGTIKKISGSVTVSGVSDVLNLVATANAITNILSDKGFKININNLTSFSKNLSGDASAKMVQNIIDINGDSIPDLIQSNGIKANVYYGKLDSNETVSYNSSNYEIIDNLGYMSGSEIENEEIYNGSFSPLGALVPQFSGKGKFLGAVLSGALSTAGISAAESENSQKYGFIDVNGDGLCDYVRNGLVFLNVGGNKLLLSQTAHTVSNLGEGANLSVGLSLTPTNLITDKTCPQLVNLGTPTLSLTDTSSATISTLSYNDINGDGLVDKIEKQIDDDFAKVYYNNGSSFEESGLIDFVEWDVTGCVTQFMKCSDGDVFKDSWLAGTSVFNSSAMTDFAYLNPFGANERIMRRYTNMLDFSNTMSISLEGGFGQNFDIKIPIPLVPVLFVHVILKGDSGANTNYSFTGVTTQLTDINGDGLPDRVLRIPGGRFGMTTYQEHTFVQLNRLGKIGLLKAVNLPQGGRYEIEYDFVPGGNRAGSGRFAMHRVTKIENPLIQSDVYNVSYEAADNTNGFEETVNKYVTTFSYAGGFYNRSIKEFFGYDTIIKTQGSGNEAVTTVTEYYNTEYYNKGMQRRVTVSDCNGTTHSVQDYEIDSAPYARVTKKTETSYEYNDQSQGISVTTEYFYDDDWGNITSLLETTSDSTKDIYAEFDYAKDSNVLNHGLITELRAYEGNSASGTLMRRRCAAYNKAGDMLSLSTYYDKDSSSTYHFSYESNGNIKSVTAPNSMKNSFTYYTDPRFVRTVSVTGNGCDTYISEYEWEFARELKKKETDPNKNSMKYEYDTQGRLKEVWTPEDKDSPAVSYEYRRSEDGLWYSITTNKTLYDRSVSSSNPVIQTVAVSDGLGRVKWTAKTGCVTDGGTETKRGWNVSGLVTYDSLARTKASGMVQFSEAWSMEALLCDEKILVNPSYTEYDAKGRTVKSILPKDSEGNTPESRTEYIITDGMAGTVSTDPLKNRTVQVSDARGNIVYMEKQDSHGKKLTSVNYSYDVIGQMLEAYNEDSTKPITVTYDLAGRMTSLASTDSGEKHFFYDEAGNKVREDDSLLRSKGEQIKYEYDGMNRLVRIDYPETADTVYEYGGANAGGNGAGKIIKTTDSTGSIEYKYGSLGEVVEETRSIYRMSADDSDGTSITATMKYVSDYLGRMQEITYPDGEVVTYGYDEGGQVNRVSGVRGSYSFDYVDSITYDEYGQRAYIKYANGAETHYTYDRARRWLSHIKTESRLRTIQNTNYRFDFVGNVLRTSDNCDLWRTTQTYEYDSLYQLTGATGTTYYTANGITDYANSTYRQDFSFDSTGNMLTKVSSISNSSAFTTKNNNSLSYSLTYSYNPDFAHRLSNVNGRYYDYDLNGNLTVEQDAPIGSLGDTSMLTPIPSQKVGDDVYKDGYGWAISNPDKKKGAVVRSNVYQRTFIWDERNMIKQSSDSAHTVKYRYGADGQRTNKYSVTNDKGESIYFNKLWTWRWDSYTPSSGNYCKNIFLDKTRIVTKVRAADETASSDAHREYFYHGDHLQSATLITDYEGAVYERINYTPYGELWLEKSDNNGENYLPYRFTGKELDSETGLYYYGARYLDPKYSMWISTDPALSDYMSGSEVGGGGIYNHFNFNLYHYAANNPVRYTDPNGEVIFLAIPAAVVAAKAAAWFVGSLAICAVGGYVIGKTAENAVEYAKGNSKPEAKPKDEPSPMPEEGTKSGSKDGHSGSVPDDPNVTGHIFDPKKEGHLPEDTPENRGKLDDVGNDEDSYLGRDQYGNDWHGKINEDGSQTWTESRNGRIFDGGVNKEPKTFDPKTGLKSPERPW